MADFLLPDVGEGLTEAQILTWQVAVGDTVKVNDVLLEIETAKSIVELPSPFAGTVTELLVAEGETVPVGTPIVRIAVAGEQAPEGETREPTDEGPEGGVLVGYGPRDHGARRRRRGSASTGSAAGEPQTGENQPRERVRAKPPVRHLARQLGIDLADVPRAGDVVTRAEVEAWAAECGAGTNGQVSVRATSDRSVPGAREPLSMVRRTTAQAMVTSAFTAPHVTEWLQVDVSASVELVELMRSDPNYRDVPVSILVPVARAVCLALRRTPMMHAQWAETEILHPENVGLGIATATDRGLLVPVVEAAELLTTPDLAAAIAAAVETARSGRITAEQMSNGTFTLTNVGKFGVEGGTPILPPGQTGILALGAVARRPWVDPNTDEIVARWVMTLSLSFDHRVVDGADASAFLADVAAILREPGRAVMF